MRKILYALAVAFSVLVTGTASAQTVTEQQLLSHVSGTIEDALETHGQVLIVPAGVTRLQQFTLRVSGDVTPVVRGYNNATSTIGAVLHTGAPLDGAPLGDVTTIIPAGGLAVTPGSYIFIGATQNAPGATGIISATTPDGYSNGFLAGIHGGVSTTKPTFDAYFVAVFGPEPVVAVPTMTEWTLLLMGLMLAGGACLYIHRRRVTA